MKLANFGAILMSEIQELQVILNGFAFDRDWQKYHTPANLAKAICIEASELLEPFLWNNQDLNWKNCPNPLLESLSDEMADIFIYLLQFCDKMGIDLIASTKNKIRANEQKYPIEKCKGRATKYDAL
jgi:dCTP diphosphatase